VFEGDNAITGILLLQYCVVFCNQAMTLPQIVTIFVCVHKAPRLINEAKEVGLFVLY
jgi:hypothetical protein